MMKQKGSANAESYWDNMWGRPKEYQNTGTRGLEDKIASEFMSMFLTNHGGKVRLAFFLNMIILVLFSSIII